MSEIVFGIHAVTSVLNVNSKNIIEIYLQDNFAKNRKLKSIADIAEKYRIKIIKNSKHDLDVLCQGGNHQGVAIKMVTQELLWNEAKLFDHLASIESAKFILLLDQIQDPHNLGACLRTAAAAGVHAVIAPKDGSVAITSTVRKIACGAAERIPYVQVTNLSRTMKKLQDIGIWITGTDLKAEAMPYDIDFKDDIAIVIGSEGKGLRRLVKEHCDHLVRIPMPGEFESLNASVATGVMLFEVVRQRTVK